VDGVLYLVTNEDAPRYHIFKVDCARPDRANWKEIVPQSESVIETSGEGESLVIGGRLFVKYIRNAASQLKIFDLDGKHVADVPMPTLGSIFSGIGGNWDSREAFF